MSADRRLLPANGRVAAAHLEGSVVAESYVAGTPAMVLQPCADLCVTPAGKRDRQWLLGTKVTVFENLNGWSFVQSRADGFVGYVDSNALGPGQALTHRVSTRATHLYETESFKSRDLGHLSFGSSVTVTRELHKFWETPQGFIPKKHLRPLDKPFSDPATIAQLFFGTPYLWGGNSALGIDCSGLIQAALMACDVYCPADSDMQCNETGRMLDADTPLQRGDLVFWTGHVGMMVDADTLLHANAHHMATQYEPFSAATLRIKTQGDGDIIARKRLG